MAVLIQARPPDDMTPEFAAELDELADVVDGLENAINTRLVSDGLKPLPENVGALEVLARTAECVNGRAEPEAASVRRRGDLRFAASTNYADAARVAREKRASEIGCALGMWRADRGLKSKAPHEYVNVVLTDAGLPKLNDTEKVALGS